MKNQNKEVNVFELPFDTEAEAINEIGIKFWLDKSTTEYAKRKGLKGLQAYFIESKDGYQSRCLVENGLMVYENQNLEALAAHIDFMALDKEFK